MKTTLTKKQITEILKHVVPVMYTKSEIPVLNYLKFSSRNTESKGLGASPRQLVVTATDLEQNINVFIDSEIINDNESFLVPVALLKRMKKLLKKKQWLTISGNNKKQTLVLNFNNLQKTEETLVTEEWPEITQRFNQNNIFSSVDADKFMALYKKAVKFTSTDPLRQALTGVYVDAEHQKIVGTDGRQLVAFAINNLPKNGIIPNYKFLNKKSVMKNLESGKIEITEDLFTLQTNKYTYSCKIIKENYPNWTEVFPDTPGTSKLHFTDNDIEIINETARMLPKENYRLDVVAENNKIAVKAESFDMPRILQGKSENSATFTVNIKFLVDILNSGFYTMKVISDFFPIVFEQDGDAAIVMPLSIPVEDKTRENMSRQIRNNTEFHKQEKV